MAAASPKKVAVVTGANQGIGFELARQLGKENFVVVLGCRRAEAGREAVKALEADGIEEAVFLPVDLADAASMDSLASDLEKRFGRVDVLLNNAGIAFKGSDPTPFAEQAEPTVEVNYFGTLRLTQKLEGLLRKSSDPRVVTVASRAGALRILKSDGLRDFFTNRAGSLTLEALSDKMRAFVKDAQDNAEQNSFAKTNYGMSKLGLISLTALLQKQEGSDGIGYSAYCPGWCSTNMSSHSGNRTAAQGAETGTFLATTGDKAVYKSGGFFGEKSAIKW